MLPEHIADPDDLYLKKLFRTSRSAMTGICIQEFVCPMRHVCQCCADMQLVTGPPMPRRSLPALLMISINQHDDNVTGPGCKQSSGRHCFDSSISRYIIASTSFAPGSKTQDKDEFTEEEEEFEDEEMSRPSRCFMRDRKPCAIVTWRISCQGTT